MPLKRCGDGGKGWKYGDSGHCYTGPGAKKKAIKQGLAITNKTGEKFHSSNFAQENDISEQELQEVIAELSLADQILLSHLENA